MHAQERTAKDQAGSLASLTQTLADREAGLEDAGSQLKQMQQVSAVSRCMEHLHDDGCKVRLQHCVEAWQDSPAGQTRAR